MLLPTRERKTKAKRQFIGEEREKRGKKTQDEVRKRDRVKSVVKMSRRMSCRGSSWNQMSRKKEKKTVSVVRRLPKRPNHYYEKKERKRKKGKERERRRERKVFRCMRCLLWCLLSSRRDFHMHAVIFLRE